MNSYIGIDPGIDTGGISILRDDMSLTPRMTPRIDGKGDIDLMAISSWILDEADAIQEAGGGTLVVGVEDVHSIFGSSASSNFAFGGRRREPVALFNMLAEMERRYAVHKDVKFMFEEVQPKVWQKEVWTTADKVFDKSKVDTKATSIRCALRLFPEVTFTLPWSGKGVKPKKIQDGMCDSSLIAEYFRRKFKLY